MNSRARARSMNAAADSLDAVIVGGGQAGVTTSYFLQRKGVRHLVLEKERAFSQWYRRWDSFHMNTANWMNALPGAQIEFAPGSGRNELGSKEDALRYFEAYRSAVDPPLRERTEVTSVVQQEDSTWRVVTAEGSYDTPCIVICTGALRTPKLPALADQLHGSIPQIHSSEYRNPRQIEAGHVLVVGSGNSGIQICEDLARSSRFKRLTLAVSGNMIFPLKVLGIPLYTLARWLRVGDITADSWLGRKLINPTKGDPAIPPSPAQLARHYGVNLVGKVASLEETGLRCSDGRTVPLEDLQVVWCTGFEAGYDFIQPLQRARAFDPDGHPVHERGVALDAAGLYFVGMRFQYTLVSQDLYGVGRDAEYVARRLAGQLAR